jgi:hypothetical protein
MENTDDRESVSINKYEFDWNKKCKKHGINNPSILHKKFKINIHRVHQTILCEVMGAENRKQRYPVIVKEVDSDKYWKISVSSLGSC